MRDKPRAGEGEALKNAGLAVLGPHGKSASKRGGRLSLLDGPRGTLRIAGAERPTPAACSR